MRIVATGASGTTSNRLQISWRSTFPFPVKLTEMFYSMSDTSTSVVNGGMYMSTMTTVGGSSSLMIQFITIEPSSYSDRDHMWQPNNPVTIYQGDIVTMYSTSKSSAVRYFAGFNIEV